MSTPKYLTVFSLAMSKQDLNGSQVASGLVNHGCLRATHGVCSVLGATETYSSDPFVDQPGILPGTQMTGAINSAGKGVVVYRAAAVLEPD